MTYTGLYLGDLHLTGTAAAGYKVETLAEGTDFGNPEPVEAVVQSLLQDGELVEHLRDGNRAQNLRIRITGTAAQLQLGEAALMAELYRRNTLTVPSLLAGGATTVFDVVTSSLEQIPDDLAEIQANQRHYSIRLVSAPFGRSEDEVVTPALATGTTTVVVADGSSTTNWTAVGGTLSTAGGAVKNTGPTSGLVELDLVYTAAVDMSATPYLVVDWSYTQGTSHPNVALTVFADGVALERIAARPTTGGYLRYTYECPDASVAQITVRATPGTSTTSTTAAVLSIDSLSRTDVAPSLGSPKQLLRSLAVPGSVRGPGRLTVEDEASALGDVLLYAFPDDGSGYVPALRQFYTSGGSLTAAAGSVSGFTNMLDVAQVYDIPARSVPEGGHVLMARLTGSAAGAVTLTVTASVRVGGNVVGPVQTFSVPLTLTTSAANYTLTRLMPVNVSVGNMGLATVHLTIVDADTSGIDVTLDEAYLFAGIGQLISVSCGTGSTGSGLASRRLFVVPPGVENPLPRVLRGDAADMSDAFYAFTNTGNAESWQDPEFTPPGVAVFSVTSNVDNAQVSLAAYPHWHTHAGS